MTSPAKGKAIRIGRQSIGSGHPPFIIAEMSGNHNGSLERALAIVDAVAKTGAQALKIQTYTADTMTLDIRRGEFMIDDPKSLWNGYSLYDLYKKAHTPWEWHRAIFDRCRKQGLIGFSTPFDATAVDFLESLDVPLYKIASFESIDIPLIRRAAATRKPLIISTGMASTQEIKEAVHAARKAGCRDLILLKCTSAYPADPALACLTTIPDMRRRFKCPIGLSDHTIGIGVSVASVAMGAVALERHVTLKRADGGVDSAFSLEPAELKLLVEESRRAAVAMGKPFYGPTPAEKTSLLHRRSLYFSADIAAGEPITPNHIRSIRPGLGLPPKFYDELLGRQVKQSIRKGTPMRWDLVKSSKKGLR